MGGVVQTSGYLVAAGNTRDLYGEMQHLRCAVNMKDCTSWIGAEDPVITQETVVDQK